MKVFRDVVSAHHWVFSVAKILHRDLSATNLMVQRIGKEINGILADFDLAVGESKKEQDEEVKRLRRLDSDSTPPSQRTERVTSMEVNPVREKEQTDKKCQKMRFRTGTGPFMAIDILKSKPTTPIHVYRYDLESFFYVLVWFCAGFDPKFNTLASIDSWRTPSYEDIAKNKEAFINDSKQTISDAIFANTHSSYQPLVKAWIHPLRLLFKEVLSCASRLDSDIKEISVHQDKLDALVDDASLSLEEMQEQCDTTNQRIEELVLTAKSAKDKLDTLPSYKNFIAKLKVVIFQEGANNIAKKRTVYYNKFAGFDPESLR
ncbi:EKC/KEOPS complex subunit BUD32 [Abortiporus biennis]